MKKRDFLKILGGAALAPMMPHLAGAANAPAFGAGLHVESPGLALTTPILAPGEYTLSYYLRKPGEEWKRHESHIVVTDDDVTGITFDPDEPVGITNIQLWQAVS